MILTVKRACPLERPNTGRPPTPHLTNRVPPSYKEDIAIVNIFFGKPNIHGEMQLKMSLFVWTPKHWTPLPTPTWQTGCHQAVIKTNSICLRNSFCWKDSPDFVPSRGQNNEKEVTFVIVVRYICKIRVISIDYIPFTLLHVDLTAWISRSHESVLSECYNTLRSDCFCQIWKRS